VDALFVRCVIVQIGRSRDMPPYILNILCGAPTSNVACVS
jgi:hypothetical protein